jgi:hypothetical protein
VIFQTFAGLSLDIENKSVESEDNSVAIQHLLNVFAFLNAIQLCGILGLKWLDRRRQAAAASRPVSALLSSELSPETRGRSRYRQLKGQSHDDSADDAGQEVEDEHGPFPSTSSPEQRRPLLPHRRSQVSLDECQLQEEVDGTGDMKGMAASQSEARRGEYFAISGSLLIVLTWVLFMTTAWLKLRSKTDREKPPGKVMH